MKQLRPEQLNRPSLSAYQQRQKLPVCIVLDNIRSGLNVGAIFRTADAFAIECIYLCGITVRPPHAEIMKTALGATASVPWKYVDQTEMAFDELSQKGYQLVPVEQTDKSIPLDKFDLAASLPVAFIFGNEMRGVDANILSRCSISIEIPQAGIKHSLNVATTAGIILWESYRQLSAAVS